jgi:hypothetical protein
MNIEHAWRDAESGVLTIETPAGPLHCQIAGFSRVQDKEELKEADHEY